MVKVSVVMPVYNGEKHVEEAIESILSQKFIDFEMIIVDDCSTDNTARILKTFTDSRLRIHRHSQNRGVAAALNTGWRHATASYIAIMHADDISLPQRLARQYDFFEQHPDIGILGCSIQCIDQTGKYLQTFIMQSSAALAGWELHFTCPLAHPTVMLRRDILERTAGYCADMNSVEDYDLWSRASDYTQISNLPEVLLHYRVWEGSITAQNQERMERQSTIIVQQITGRRVQQDITVEEANCLRRLSGSQIGKAPGSRGTVRKVVQIVDTLYHHYLERFDCSAEEKRLLVQNVALKLIVLCRLSVLIAPEQSLLLVWKAFRLYPFILKTVIYMKLTQRIKR